MPQHTEPNSNNALGDLLRTMIPDWLRWLYGILTPGH